MKAGVNIVLRQCNEGNQCQKKEVDFHCLFVFVDCLCFFLVMICDKIGSKFFCFLLNTVLSILYIFVFHFII